MEIEGVKTPLRSLPYEYWHDRPVSFVRSIALTPQGWTIPRSTDYSIQHGDTGILPWAVQTALSSLGYALTVDGDYGDGTKATVAEFQRKNSLGADGVFGPNTSRQAALRVCGRSLAVLPKGLLRGFVDSESGGYIGAVNWSVPGGVDVCYFQRRVYEGDYADDAAVQRAFDAPYQRDLLGKGTRSRYEAYLNQAGVDGNHELAWRLAALYHNYPTGAAKIAEVGYEGLSSYWRNAQNWVTNIGARFPDGAPVTTPLEWCRHYALGAPPHNDPGQVTKYVTDWTP